MVSKVEESSDIEITVMEPVQTGETSKKERYLSIDILRGIAIVGMIFANTILPFENTPKWSKHAVDYGLTYVDLGAPLFILAITLTYAMSFNSYLQENGYLKTYIRYLRRYGAFLGFGVLGGRFFISVNMGIKFSWGVLQAIGLAGMFTLIFLRFPRIVRLIAGIASLAAYQVILGIPVEVSGEIITLSNLSYYDLHGGLIGGIGFSIMTLLGTAVVDDFRKIDKKQLLIFGFVFTSVGTALHFIWLRWGFPPYGGISKERVTPSYVLVALGLCLIFFWIVWYLYDVLHITKDRSRFLQPFGKNSFFMYILHPLFILFATLYLPNTAHLALVIFAGLLNVFVLWGIAYFMDRYKIYISI
ncbi:MAG: heparan-alpha-glucosaminide N-acetyltransferase domain-containing protein [Candidatus Heimdallarchaeaceae archaeon]|jgi:predicted acyltransferase